MSFSTTATVISSATAFASAFLAFLAARLWLRSAKVETPKEFQIDVARPIGPAGMPIGKNPAGGIHVGSGQSEQLDQLGQGLSWQSELSAKAAHFAGWSAVCAAVSVSFQAVSILLAL
jgi:hypothetical protein